VGVGERRGPLAGNVPTCRLICSRAHRAVSRVRLEKSALARVSLVKAVKNSWRKYSRISPLGNASARSLSLVSGCQEGQKQYTYPMTPQDERRRASVRLVSDWTMRRSSKMESRYWPSI
jgi:hypothetical protein